MSNSFDNPNDRPYNRDIVFTFNSDDDVINFQKRFNHANNYDDGTVKLSRGNRIVVNDGMYTKDFIIAGFDFTKVDLSKVKDYNKSKLHNYLNSNCSYSSASKKCREIRNEAYEFLLSEADKDSSNVANICLEYGNNYYIFKDYGFKFDLY